MTALPRPPAHVERYVRVLGAETTVDFLCEFGGAEIFLSPSPSGRSKVARRFGLEAATALAAAAATLPKRVPTARRWLARALHARGLPVAEIARRLHTTDVTVRGYLKDGDSAASRDSRQLPLF